MSNRYQGGVISATPVTASSSVASGIWTLSQQAELKQAGNWPPTLPVIGAAFGGGFFAGQIDQSGTIYNLVVGPVASAESSSIRYKNANTAATGADSVIDGPQNTADLVADGNSTVYPAAHFCNDLVIGGFSDWYMPAKNELEVCYYNLKPTIDSNNTSVGINTNAVPSRGRNYTSGTPAQTSATDFKDTGAEDFTPAYYWSSTEATTTRAWFQTFYDGNQGNDNKSGLYRLRAVRRVVA
jgi:hypothetical protein